jgi:hypothetical protein
MYDKAFTGEINETYPAEPTDRQANVIVRALAHWVSAYEVEPDRTVQSVVLDVLESNGASIDPLSGDECETLAELFGLEV